MDRGQAEGGGGGLLRSWSIQCNCNKSGGILGRKIAALNPHFSRCKSWGVEAVQGLCWLS